MKNYFKDWSLYRRDNKEFRKYTAILTNNVVYFLGVSYLIDSMHSLMHSLHNNGVN